MVTRLVPTYVLSKNKRNIKKFTDNYHCSQLRIMRISDRYVFVFIIREELLLSLTPCNMYNANFTETYIATD